MKFLTKGIELILLPFQKGGEALGRFLARH